MRILFVEDDECLAESLTDALTRENYRVDQATDGQAGLDFAEAFDYDLILLDWMLPKLDGIQVCKQLRDRQNFTPVLLLTAQNTSDDQVIGLDAGADDYLVKPIALPELLARIRALLRRGTAKSSVLEWGSLQLHLKNSQFTYDAIPLPLTSKEYGLLELLLRNRQRIFSQQALIEHLWSLEETPTENTVRAHIKSLRQKLKKAGCEDLIETIYGFGYRLNAQAEVRQPVISSKPSLGSSILPELVEVWQQHRSHYLDRLQIIDQAVIALQSGTLSATLQNQALREAHTLIGSLGSFGLDHAAVLSRQIEQGLKKLISLASPSQKEIKQLRQTLIALRQSMSDATIGAPSPSPQVVSDNSLARLLIVDDDQALVDQIVIASRSINPAAQTLHAEGVTDLTQARTAIRRNVPDVVLLDLSFPDGADDGFGLLTELAAHQPPIPVIVFTAKEGFSDRVKVARLGGKGFLQKPISSSQVIATVQHVLQQSSQTQAKLMIVDDDPQVLDVLHTLLLPWGFQLTLVDAPDQIWHRLEQIHPDLLILSIEMPGLSGIDLCQVIRNDLQWGSLPVLVLSAHTDPETIARVFIAGADDYVRKPIVESELVARVLNRLERVQLLRQLTLNQPFR